MNLTDFERSLARDGAITRFWRQSLFDDAIRWLSDHEYFVSPHDAQRWVSDADLFSDLAHSLNFRFVPSNMDALSGILRRPDSEWAECGRKICVCITNFDVFLQRHSLRAQQLLDIIIRTSRDLLLDDRLILCLLQTEDPDIELPICGCVVARWNASERQKRYRAKESKGAIIPSLWTGVQS